MKYIRGWVFMWLAVVVSTLQAQIGAVMDEAMAHLPAHLTASVVVRDVSTGKELYAHQADVRMRPGSTMKLLTAVAALDSLGAEHPFRTTAYCHAIPQNGIIDDTLYIKSEMDPLLTRKDLDALALQLRQKGVKSINGVIAFDNTAKDTIRWGAGWCWDDNNPILTPLLCHGGNEFEEQCVLALLDAGIKIDGYIVEHRVPEGMPLIYSGHHTLGEVLEPMLKDSNNLSAECVFYHLSMNKGGAATSRASQAKEKTWLKGVSGESPYCRVADGSGLSLYNYINARTLTDLLYYAHLHPQRIYEPLLKALPIAGVDGTLKHRLRTSDVKRKVRAKTGTLYGVSALAGYLVNNARRPICFAIIVQGVQAQREARGWQDYLLRQLAHVNQ